MFGTSRGSLETETFKTETTSLVKWRSASGLSGDYGCRQQQPTGELKSPRWNNFVCGLAATWCLMGEFMHDGSIMNIIRVLQYHKDRRRQSKWYWTRTEQRDKKWIVVRHNDQIHYLIGWASLQVAKWMADVVVLPTTTDKYLANSSINMNEWVNRSYRLTKHLTDHFIAEYFQAINCIRTIMAAHSW